MTTPPSTPISWTVCCPPTEWQDPSQGTLVSVVEEKEMVILTSLPRRTTRSLSPPPHPRKRSEEDLPSPNPPPNPNPSPKLDRQHRQHKAWWENLSVTPWRKSSRQQPLELRGASAKSAFQSPTQARLHRPLRRSNADYSPAYSEVVKGTAKWPPTQDQLRT